MAETISIANQHIEYNRHPDKCPQCHFSCSPEFLTASAIFNGNGKVIELRFVYKCPNRDCQDVFIGEFRGTVDRRTRQIDNPFKLHGLAPVNIVSPSFDRNVSDLSPDYVKIFTQASAAESYGLDQVAGAGYRKALEFLIKDYCIFQRPGDEETIKRVSLSRCINNYVENQNVKACADRASWLGNDETHYEREWINKDIEDLKALIHLTSTWIESELATLKLLEEMQKKDTPA